MKKISFTKNELEIMEVLWNQERALSRSEIINLSPDRSWKASSIHILLNKMLDKGAIRVDGYIRTGKNYGRAYFPAITRDDYSVMQVIENDYYKNSNPTASLALFSALLKDDGIDETLLDELQKMINERKKEIQQ